MSNKKQPRLLTVSNACHLTPNMIRVTFSGPALAGFPAHREGANCKLLLPEFRESLSDFRHRLETGPAPLRRTYTVRHYRPDKLELDIDFVDHGGAGPASAWARAAAPGSFLGFAGPSRAKLQSFDADYYLLVADMSAIPVVAATLEAMPCSATGLALFEVTSLEDVQQINAPCGIEMRWMVHPNPHKPSTAMVDIVRQLDWPDGRIQTCIAGEHEAIRALRELLLVKRGLPKEDAYIAGYWKIGLVEDEHQALKRAEAN